ncbi:Gibberellin-regulated family protein [Perilla frutescens var. hirtella]|uniref:Gibberellin-regulated family protein n=1 Tax=Perilla frutescens var. hirtella TaxID=608512 RepID=A0AAD4JMJ6_PERFH|nr:Gibberellin-regulated family protein [Perilla frutescens var. hirtella]KAH6836074.1 Gibberellin-regulated family protein [Perilla frutescens var. hirtella]
MKPTMTTNVILALIALLLIVTTAFAAEVDVGGPPTFCEAKCGVRCSKAGRRDRCLKYCGICCDKCLCVPSGTYGNKDECPCYRDMKNSKGQPKCP